MAKDRKLKAALDRHQGKDLKLEQQKKLQRDAKKSLKRRKHEEANTLDGELEAENSVDGDQSGSEENGIEQQPVFDLSRLDDSESESDYEDDVDQTAANAGTNGVGLQNGIADTEDDDASIALSDISAPSDGEDLVPHQRLSINNTAALTKALKSISLPYSSLAFSDHQTITSLDPVIISDVNDDLNRELAFYAQALHAANEGRQLLKDEGAPFTRPTDYFAEMVKTDEHMGKIKAKLMDDAAAKKASAEARKQRDLKKFGKQVQQEKLKERAKEKRDMLDKVKILKRKRQSSGIEADREENLFDVALEDTVSGNRKDREGRRSKATGQPNAKRAKKNERYGFGGKKRFAKSTDAASTGDMSGFSTKRMKARGSVNGAKKRVGKARRAKQG